jgi:hypothetical protein
VRSTAFSSLRNPRQWDGVLVRVKSSTELSDDDAAAVAEVSQTAHGIKVKLHDKVGALEKLGRHLFRTDQRAGIETPVRTRTPPLPAAARRALPSWRWGGYDDVVDTPAQQEFAGDQPGFDRLARRLTRGSRNALRSGGSW